MSDARTTEEALAFLRRMRGWWDNSGGRHTESREWDAALNTLTSRLEALEAEHEAVREMRWRESLRRMKPLDPDWSSDIGRLFRTFDNAERVMKP